MNINSIIFQYAAIGDYLFLIMIVVASIIQAITQNKKKKVFQEVTQNKTEHGRNQTVDIMEAEPETMKGYDSPIDNIFDSIERMLVPELEGGKQTWGDDAPETTLVAEKISKEADQNFSASEEKLMHDIDARHTELVTAKPVTEIQAIRYKSSIRDGFSLRKAVIYSEILNRKYT